MKEFNTIKINNPKVRDKFFCSIAKYKDLNFFKSIMCGWKIYECVVVKVTPKYYDVSYDSQSRKYPDRLKKGITTSLAKTEIPLWENIIQLHVERHTKKPYDEVDNLKIIKRAKLKIKKLEE